jgi:hypothetical protein
LQTASYQERRFFFDLLNEKITDQKLARNFIFMLSKGIERKIQTLQQQNVYINYGGKFFKLIGPLLYIANWYLDVRIIYKSSKLILNNDFFAAFLIFISTAPNMYLDIGLASNSVESLYWGAAHHVNNLIKGKWRNYLNFPSVTRGTAHLLTVATTYSGLGGTIAIVNDYIGFAENSVLSISIVAFTALFAAKTIDDLIIKGANRLIMHFSDKDEKDLERHVDSIHLLTEKINLMTASQFSSFLSEIDRVLSYNGSLLNDLSQDEKYKGLRKKALELFTESTGLTTLPPDQ